MRQIILIMMLIFSSNLFALDVKDSNTTVEKKVKRKSLFGKNLVVFISNGNLQVAGMGLGIALSGVKQGANVTVVIGANAIKYALNDGKQNIYFAKGRTPKALLQDIIKAGAEVQLCSANTDEMNLDEEDFVEGVKIVISTQIFAKVFEEKTRVISF